MTKVKCIKCENDGYLMIRQTVSRGIKYRYWYVKHIINKKKNKTKIKWCYIGKTLPEQYKKILSNRESTQTGTQKSTQNITGLENLNSRLVNENKQGNNRAGSSVWYERRLRKAEAAGSNPARSTYF